MVVNAAKFVAGGSPVSPTAEALQASQIPSNTTLLQPGAVAFRLSDAIQENVAIISALTEGSASDITVLQNQVATLQGQVSTLQGQIAPLQAFMNSFNFQQLEIATGTFYLNGAQIYRRSFVPPSTIFTANQINVYAHGIAALGYVVQMLGVASVYQGQTLPMTFVQTNAQPMANGLSVWADNVNIYVSVGTTGFTTYTAVITMWYTATDR